MSEPRLEDDVALGRNEVCSSCDEVECVCSSYDTLEEMLGDA
jgi:hypothetical protein